MPSILCPHDFTSCSDPALALACELATLLKQPIELMHAYQLPFLPEPSVGMGMGMSLEGMDGVRKQVAERLEELERQVAKKGLSVSVRLVEGNPPHKVSERAQSPEISMVVMGTHGRNTLGRALLGSVAERVLRTAKVPVLTVRSAD
jgi:nucleotide-binding universal stress UspA family protein